MGGLDYVMSFENSAAYALSLYKELRAACHEIERLNEQLAKRPEPSVSRSEILIVENESLKAQLQAAERVVAAAGVINDKLRPCHHDEEALWAALADYRRRYRQRPCPDSSVADTPESD